jgi:hypothetical protein
LCAALFSNNIVQAATKAIPATASVKRRDRPFLLLN